MLSGSIEQTLEASGNNLSQGNGGGWNTGESVILSVVARSEVLTISASKKNLWSSMSTVKRPCKESFESLVFPNFLFKNFSPSTEYKKCSLWDQIQQAFFESIENNSWAHITQDEFTAIRAHSLDLLLKLIDPAWISTHFASASRSLSA